MATDFLSALRSNQVSRLARTQQRQARLSGRPLTQAETAAPYEALAATAGDRLARAKSLQLQETGQEKQFGLAERQMEQQAGQFAEQQRLEQERLLEARRQSDQQLNFYRDQMEEQLMAAEAARKQDKTTSMVQTGLAGAAILGEYGKDIGKIGGSIVSGIGKLFSGCVIVSACNGPDSYEVDVTRAFRDTFLGLYSLMGYYAMAHFIVPLMERSRTFKRIVKICLVDHLIDYGEWALGLKPDRVKTGSMWVSRAFLWGIRTLGRVLERRAV